jgi:uncharacterized protein (DUF433 family)
MVKRRPLDLKQDPRELPAYRIAEAAHYLQIPSSTLRSWTVGRHYPTAGGKRFFEPLVTPAERTQPLLSFINLVEVHVLDAIRREHGVRLPKVRKALAYLRAKIPSKHPLVDQRFETDSLKLFVERYGRLISISQAGQLAIRKLIEAHLRRVERDPLGVPIRLYPFTRKRDPDEPRSVVIDPYIGYGRPVLTGTGIPTAVIAERYKAGDSVDVLADDYGRGRADVEEAIRCELQLQAA